MENTLLELGIGGMFGIMILKEVFSFLRSRKTENVPCPVLQDIQKKVDDLWDWHNVNDSDGTKIWYVKRSFEETVVKLADNIEKQTIILDRLVQKLKDAE